jgi:hypothetical protein
MFDPKPHCTRPRPQPKPTAAPARAGARADDVVAHPPRRRGVTGRGLLRPLGSGRWEAHVGRRPRGGAAAAGPARARGRDGCERTPAGAAAPEGRGGAALASCFASSPRAQQRLEGGVLVAAGRRQRALRVLPAEAHLRDARHLGGVVPRVPGERLGPVPGGSGGGAGAAAGGGGGAGGRARAGGRGRGGEERGRRRGVEGGAVAGAGPRALQARRQASDAPPTPPPTPPPPTPPPHRAVFSKVLNSDRYCRATTASWGSSGCGLDSSACRGARGRGAWAQGRASGPVVGAAGPAAAARPARQPAGGSAPVRPRKLQVRRRSSNAPAG